MRSNRKRSLPGSESRKPAYLKSGPFVPEGYVILGESGIAALDFIDTQDLPVDKSDRSSRRIEFEDLPDQPEQRAFSIIEQFCDLEGINLESLPLDQRIHYTSLVTAAAECVLPGPNGELCELTEPEVTVLHGEEVLFLQAFAIHAREVRTQAVTNGQQSQFADAQAFFSSVYSQVDRLRDYII